MKENIKNIAYIGLGSNRGDREKYLNSAIEIIDSDPGCDVDVVSSVYETKPFGVEGQSDFLNAVIRINTKYTPVDLFYFLKKTEEYLGRKKTIKWGPREIDLDILFYNDLIFTDDRLTIPHKGILERDFVLVPLCEIDPDFIHPVTGERISNLVSSNVQSNIKNKFRLIVPTR